MLRLFIALGLGILLYFFFRWLSRLPRRVRWQWIGILVAVVLLAMVATGRAHWLTAVFAALLASGRVILTLLDHIPLVKRILSGINASADSTPDQEDGQTSTVQSRYVRMTLNHGSGNINGEVLEGNFKGRTLNQMQLDELLLLLQECRGDEESAALVQAYLDRMHEDWQQKAGDHGQQQAPTTPGEMTHAEALEILGLETGASEDEIIMAHKRLMQKLMQTEAAPSISPQRSTSQRTHCSEVKGTQWSFLI